MHGLAVPDAERAHASCHEECVVIGAGRHYEEFSDVPEYKPQRNRAHELLQRRAMWWQPAYVASADHPAEPLIAIFYRIHIDRVTGHRAMPNPVQAATLGDPKATIVRTERPTDST